MEELAISNTDPNSNSSSMLSVMIRRVMSSLSSSRPKKLKGVMAQIDNDGAKIGFVGGVVVAGGRVCEGYDRERDEAVNDVLVSMIEHDAKSVIGNSSDNKREVQHEAYNSSG
ncbi:hypothetical protein AKJ16_DCAP17856 [Drosera capensis]